MFLRGSAVELAGLFLSRGTTGLNLIVHGFVKQMVCFFFVFGCLGLGSPSRPRCTGADQGLHTDRGAAEWVCNQFTG